MWRKLLGAGNSKEVQVTSLRSKIAVIGLGLVLAGSLAGCTSSPGQAVSGNGFSYSESEVSTVIVEYAELIGQDSSDIDRYEVVLILGEATVLLQLAEEMGRAITDEDVEESLATAVEVNGSTLTMEDLSPVTVTLVKSALASGYLYQSHNTTEIYWRLQELLTEAEIEVSPRYGVFQEGILYVPVLGDVLSVAEKSEISEAREETSEYSDTESESETDADDSMTEDAED